MKKIIFLTGIAAVLLSLSGCCNKTPMINKSFNKQGVINDSEKAYKELDSSTVSE